MRTCRTYQWFDSPYWKEDIRCSVAGDCDAIRILKTETEEDVKLVEKEVVRAECEFGRPEGSVLIMAAVESARGVMNALEICEASDRLFGVALSGEDYTKDLQTHTGIELMGARQNLVIAARAAGVQCFDTVYTDLDNMEGFRQDVETIHFMGFDSVEQSVEDTVFALRNHPLMPKDIKIYGFIMDSTTGELSEVPETGEQ